MKTVNQRLNNITGQIEGVKKMIDKGEDCTKVLIQLKAIKSAVEGVVDEMVNHEIDRCLKDINQNDKKLLINLKKYV
ncbi:MAG: metal-sensitive transcriptional regulator [Candidatus Shapirobacteria bacterium]|jgi:DNA-binding FrmR family transcriptional regulator